MENLILADEQIKQVLHMLSTELSETLLGVYLYGSAVQGGLRQNSDIDFLVVVSEKLSEKTKARLIKNTEPLSKRIGETSKLRYVEMTVIVEEQIRNWTYPPKQDFVYGEWLQDDYQQGYIPSNEFNPDLAILLYQARTHYKMLYGQLPLEKIIPEIPFTDVKKAMIDSVNEVITQYIGDETNSLLTLCRMILTVKTGNVYAKNVAGERQAQVSPSSHKQLILLAVNSYKGEELVQWEKYDVSKTIKYLYNQLIEIS